jgi:inhibitor of cysteine peptidase
MLIGDDLNGRTVDLVVGATAEIRLAENPTAGFRWDLVTRGASACALRGDDFVPSGSAAGAGGEHRWVFEALRQGECDIELVYRRRWDVPGAAVHRFSIRLRIGG